jgi:hypothetical protein
MGQPVENQDMDMYHSRGVGPPHDDDDDGSIGGNGSMKDKGRGSYKCGRVSSHFLGYVRVFLSIVANISLTFPTSNSAVYQRKDIFAHTNQSLLADQANHSRRCAVPQYRLKWMR